MKLVSACLIGVNCNFEGKNWKKAALFEEFKKGNLLPICPEVMGGLSIPRVPAEIVGGTGEDVLCGKAKVINMDGVDVTEQFIRGANEALRIAKTVGASEVMLTENSPSCGCGKIFDGTFSEKFKDGDGVCCALLKRNGLAVIKIVTAPQS
jgi:uncharacterized protein YbbK (DUF523 family)